MRGSGGHGRHVLVVDVVRELFESFGRLIREFFVSAVRMVFLVGDGEDSDVGGDTRNNAVSDTASDGHESVAA